MVGRPPAMRLCDDVLASCLAEPCVRGLQAKATQPSAPCHPPLVPPPPRPARSRAAHLRPAHRAAVEHGLCD